MTPRRRKRMLFVMILMTSVAAAAALAITAFQKNMLYFYPPAEIQAGAAPTDREIRAGGMVVDGSVQREAGSLAVRFTLTDYEAELPVAYEGILPDLFREGQGIVARGTLDQTGTLIATEVLAKHDESYMPPEVAATLKAKPESGTDGP